MAALHQAKAGKAVEVDETLTRVLWRRSTAMTWQPWARRTGTNTAS